jgi:hypothetical protein
MIYWLLDGHAAFFENGKPYFGNDIHFDENLFFIMIDELWTKTDEKGIVLTRLDHYSELVFRHIDSDKLNVSKGLINSILEPIYLKKNYVFNNTEDTAFYIWYLFMFGIKLTTWIDIKKEESKLDEFPKEKSLQDFIINISSSEIVSFIEQLKINFKGKKGKEIAKMIAALKKLDLINIPKRVPVYNAISHDFGNIGNYSGLNSFLQDIEIDKFTLTEAQLKPTIDIINSIKAKLNNSKMLTTIHPN